LSILQNIQSEPFTHFFSFSSGAAGLIVGGFGGLAFSQNPLLFATVSGLQWLGVGSTFWCMSTSELTCTSDAEAPQTFAMSLLKSVVVAAYQIGKAYYTVPLLAVWRVL
jgi:hypothetical protein